MGEKDFLHWDFILFGFSVYSGFNFDRFHSTFIFTLLINKMIKYIQNEIAMKKVKGRKYFIVIYTETYFITEHIVSNSKSYLMQLKM